MSTLDSAIFVLLAVSVFMLVLIAMYAVMNIVMRIVAEYRYRRK